MFVRLCKQEGEMWGSAGGLLLAGRRARTESPSLPKDFLCQQGTSVASWPTPPFQGPGILPRSRPKGQLLENPACFYCGFVLWNSAKQQPFEISHAARFANHDV